MNVGDLLLSSAVLFTGNNISKIQFLLKTAKLGNISSTSYFNIQKHYLVPTVLQYWKEVQEQELLKTTGRDLVVIGMLPAYYGNYSANIIPW